MSTTPQLARKGILARISAEWAAKAPAIVAPLAAPEMRYQGLEKGALPGADKYWGRSSTAMATTRQSAHVTDEVDRSPVEYLTGGVVMVQIFAPMSVTGSYAKGELLSEAAQRMFMAGETSEGVWFRNPRINELPNDGTWHRWNVIADFQFNQVKGA